MMRLPPDRGSNKRTSTGVPEVLTELETRGALRVNALTCLPDEFTGGFRPGDERFETVTARRPVLEGAVAAVAAERQDCGSVAGSP